jgi:hypothetical protein
MTSWAQLALPSGTIKHDNDSNPCALGDKMSDDKKNKPTIIVEQWSPAPKVRILRTQLDEQRAKCCELLRSLLADAEQGKIVSLAVCAITGPESYGLSWASVNQGNIPKHLGYLTILRNLLSSQVQLSQQPQKPPKPQQPPPETPPDNQGGVGQA